jgi:hypothetical protein
VLNKVQKKKNIWFPFMYTQCTAKAFYSCPAIISQRPESQKTPKEPQENPEEESRIT